MRGRWRGQCVLNAWVWVWCSSLVNDLSGAVHADLWDALLDQWVDKFDVVSEPGWRKLSVLALTQCMTVAALDRYTHPRFMLIANTMVNGLSQFLLNGDEVMHALASTPTPTPAPSHPRWCDGCLWGSHCTMHTRSGVRHTMGHFIRVVPENLTNGIHRPHAD